MNIIAIIHNNYYVQSYDFWVTYIRKVLPKKVGGIGWCRRCVEGRKVRRRYNISRKGG